MQIIRVIREAQHHVEILFDGFDLRCFRRIASFVLYNFEIRSKRIMRLN